MLTYLWLLLIPAILLVLGVQYFFAGRWEPEKRVRLFLGLLAVLAGISGVVGGISRLIDSLQAALVEPGSRLCSSLGAACGTVREVVWVFSQISGPLYLLQVAVAAAIFRFLPGRRGWSSGRITLAVGLGGLALLAGAFASQSFMYFVFSILLMGGLIVLVWRAWAWNGRLRLAGWAGLVFFLGLVVLYELIPSFAWYSQPSSIFGLPFFIMGIWPAIATSLASRLWYSALESTGRASSKALAMENPDGQAAGGVGALTEQVVRAASPRPVWQEAARRLALVAAGLLLVWQLNGELAREGLWDQTNDGLTSVFIQISVISVGLAGAAVMAWSLAGWRKLGALVFAGLVLFDMSWAMQHSWQLDPTEATEAGAARIRAAMETYYDRNGSYPQDLAQLVPFYLLHIPEPFMERGEGWCYQAGPDYYRLGYVWKPGFSPQWETIKIRITSSAGQPPEGPWECDLDLERIRQHWKDYWKDAQIHTNP